MICRSDRKERGIRLNVVSSIRDYFDATPGAEEDVSIGVPLGRLGRLEDVASAVLFAASSESGFVAGHELSVDGGGAAVLPEFILLNDRPRSGMRRPTGASRCGRCAPYLCSVRERSGASRGATSAGRTRPALRQGCYARLGNSPHEITRQAPPPRRGLPGLRTARGYPD